MFIVIICYVNSTGLIEFLLSNDPRAKVLRDHIIFKIGTYAVAQIAKSTLANFTIVVYNCCTSAVYMR